MVRIRRLIPALTLALAASASTSFAAAGADGARRVEHQVVTANFLYVPNENLISEGDGLTHTNVDTEPHDLVATEFGPDGTPWFRSELIGPGESTPVPVENLPPGSYPYTCSIHPFMQGTLRVDEAEPPDPDPEVPGTPEPAEPAERGDVEIRSGDSFFEPRSITVPVGTTISWLNQGAINHTVTASDGSWDSSPLCPTSPACHQPGERYRRTFTEPGTIPYYCKIHGSPGGAGHAGTIVVVPPGEEETGLGSVTTSVSGDEVSVTGGVAFEGEAPVTVSEDPQGDGPVHPELARETGVDLTGARVFQPDPEIPSLFVDWRVADLSSAPPPEAIRYTLPFRIGEATFRIQAKRSNLAGATLAEDPEGHAEHAGYSFQLLDSCSAGPGGGCSHVAWLTGAVDPENDLIRVKVPLGAAPELAPGAVLERAEGSDPALTRIRAGYETAVEAGTPTADEAEWGNDDPEFAYRIPVPEVLLGIAPAGTPESEVTFDATATVGGGSFSGSIAAPGPGSWDVWVRACFGTNCGTAIRRVES